MGNFIMLVRKQQSSPLLYNYGPRTQVAVIYRQKKPDTFCFPLTRKVHILDINENANISCKTSKRVFKENLLIWYDIWR